MENETNEALALQDLGDATTETKQVSPLGPFWDSYYGHGWSMG